jgi:chitodextrinase
MSIRTAALAGTALVLALVLPASTAAKRAPTAADKQAPTTPTNLHITASSDTSVSLAWNASTDNSTNWWYCVQANGASCIRVDPPQTTYTHPYLTAGSTTTFTVYAIDASGNRSETSNAVTYTAPADTTPPSPAPTVTANTVTSTWLSFSWTASQDSGSEVLYTVYLNGIEYLRNLPWRFANVFALTPSATYELRVDARDSFGNISQSDVLSVTTPAPTNDVAPTAPTNVRLGFQSGSGEAWLSWDRSTDDADPQNLIVYEIYFNGVPNNLESVIGGNSTIAYCTEQGIGLTEVVLRAVDTSGNRSAPSNVGWVDC